MADLLSVAVRAGSLRLDVPSEALAHGREQLVGEARVLARAEAGVEGGRQDVGRHGFLDRGVEGPAALAGIRDEAREVVELLVAGQRLRGQVEEPGRDHAAAAPD